jgi:hypothetical protein
VKHRDAAKQIRRRAALAGQKKEHHLQVQRRLAAGQRAKWTADRRRAAANYGVKWRAENEEQYRKVQRAAKEKWRRRNLAIACAHQNKRRAAKLCAIPKWADLADIERIYQNCPAGYHVDHAIPLQGRNVCGLHVSNNLQYLPPIVNYRKHNKYQDVAGG